MNKVNERREEDRLKYEKQIERLQEKVGESELKMQEITNVHNVAMLKIKEEKQNELKMASKAEKTRLEQLSPAKDKEKNVALDELRAQLNSERDKAVNNCMKTSMGEMQKALKESRDDKEAALSHVRNEWKDKVAEQMLKYENEKKDARKLYQQKMDEYTTKIRNFEESLRLAKKNVEEKEISNKILRQKMLRLLKS